MSAEKQAEIARKKKKNNEKGQLNQHHGGNQPAGSLKTIGGNNAANLFSGLIQQPQAQQFNPMMALAGGVPQQRPQQPMPAPGLGALVPGPQVNPMPNPMMMQQPRPAVANPAFSALFAAPANPMMGGMGMGMGGMPQGGYLNPISQLYNQGGYRMW